MADTPDTPDTPKAETAKPAPRRRAAPRKPAGDGAKPRAKANSARADKGAVARSEDAAMDGAADGVTGASRRPTANRSASRSASRPAAGGGARTPAAQRSTSTSTRKSGASGEKGNGASRTRSTPAKRTSGRKVDSRSTLEKATEKVGGVRGAVGIIGGIAAAGAAAAALFTLRGSTARKGNDQGQADVQTASTAHQPDGTDSSASFQAGIADENTVPDQI